MKPKNGMSTGWQPVEKNVPFLKGLKIIKRKKTEKNGRKAAGKIFNFPPLHFYLFRWFRNLIFQYWKGWNYQNITCKISFACKKPSGYSLLEAFTYNMHEFTAIRFAFLDVTIFSSCSKSWNMCFNQYYRVVLAQGFALLQSVIGYQEKQNQHQLLQVACTRSPASVLCWLHVLQLNLYYAAPY